MKDLPISPLAPTAFPNLPEVKGMTAAAHRLGLYKGDRNDLILALFDEGTSVAGAFTTSTTRSADVNLCAAHVKAGKARALIVNAGNSNAFTGAAGEAKNAASAAEVIGLTGCAPDEVFIGATGVIGQPLPVRQVADALPDAYQNQTAPDWLALANAICTTDTFPKGAGKVIQIGGASVAIAGIAKGSGMIAPNMATMLAFVFTDAMIEASLLQSMVSEHVDTTFNSITVDSDTSTSDTLLVFATGASDAPKIGNLADGGADVFSAALHEVLHDLAMQVVRDGEGAQKLIQVRVTGAATAKSARTLAMAIGNSPLVKTAIAGEDANWGRVVMAVGKSGEPIDIKKLSVRFGGVWTARDGGAVAYDEAPVNLHMKGREIDILVDVGVGTAESRIWTCDLTHGYISINGDYRS